MQGLTKRYQFEMDSLILSGGSIVGRNGGIQLGPNWTVLDLYHPSSRQRDLAASESEIHAFSGEPRSLFRIGQCSASLSRNLC